MLLLTLVWFRPLWWPITLLTLTLGLLAISLIAVLGNRTLGQSTMRLLNYRKSLSEFLIGAGCTVGFILARLHLHIFDKLFLRQGRLRRVLK
jgi:hypothetical protein